MRRHRQTIKHHAQTMGVPGSVQEDMANYGLGHGKLCTWPIMGPCMGPQCPGRGLPKSPSPTPACSLLTHRIRHVEPSRERSWNAVRTVRGGVLHTSGVRVRGDRGPTGKRSTPPTPHSTTELTAPSHLALGLPRLLAYSPSSLESSLRSSLSHRRSNHRAERPKRVGTCSFQCSVNKPCSAT